MSTTISVERSAEIDAPIDAVWRVSAEEFEHIDRWDANVKTSRPLSDPSTTAPVGGRVCDLYNGGRTVERFVAFDPDAYRFAYEITEGLPGFVVSARNTWTHQTLGRARTRLTMRVDIEAKGLLGALMKAPLKAQMGGVLSKATTELKHYIEKGRPHPRKDKKARG
ncbi:MAG: SRPBCC family protein [Pseudomonadota bacterium]